METDVHFFEGNNLGYFEEEDFKSYFHTAVNYAIYKQTVKIEKPANFILGTLYHNIKKSDRKHSVTVNVMDKDGGQYGQMEVHGWEVYE